MSEIHTAQGQFLNYRSSLEQGTPRSTTTEYLSFSLNLPKVLYKQPLLIIMSKYIVLAFTTLCLITVLGITYYPVNNTLLKLALIASLIGLWLGVLYLGWYKRMLRF